MLHGTSIRWCCKTPCAQKYIKYPYVYISSLSKKLSVNFSEIGSNDRQSLTQTISQIIFWVFLTIKISYNKIKKLLFKIKVKIRWEWMATSIPIRLFEQKRTNYLNMTSYVNVRYVRAQGKLRYHLFEVPWMYSFRRVQSTETINRQLYWKVYLLFSFNFFCTYIYVWLQAI